MAAGGGGEGVGLMISPGLKLLSLVVLSVVLSSTCRLSVGSSLADIKVFVSFELSPFSGALAVVATSRVSASVITTLDVFNESRSSVASKRAL